MQHKVTLSSVKCAKGLLHKAPVETPLTITVITINHLVSHRFSMVFFLNQEKYSE